MAAQTKTDTVQSPPLRVFHDFETLIGYTRPPLHGGEPRMDDLASDHPTFREVRRAKIQDVRGVEDEFTLEKNGFQYYKLPQIPGDGVVDFTNENDFNILAVYYAGMSQWFAEAVGAKKVVVFDHIVRNEPYYPRDQYSMGIRGPAMRPHIDVTHEYAPEMFRDVQGRLGAEDIEEVLQSGHWQSYNLWRPIKRVKRDALAVLDANTFQRKELVSASFDRGDGHVVSMDWLMSGLEEGEPDENSHHKWYYLNQQAPDEVLAFKIYDSDLQSTNNGTPHTAVHIPGTEDEETRLSIELRCFAIF